MTMYFDSLNISTIKNDKVSKGMLIRAVGYYETGEIQRYESYAEGKHVATTAFHKNGHVESLTIYDTNENAYQQTTWYDNGNMKELAMFTKSFKTVKEGKKEVTRMEMLPLPYKVWHENGQVATNGQVDNGKKVGTWRNYDTDGNLIKTDEF
jgi:antitoxin component YwqK of YwqJK toxin-antitoxin module